MDCSGVGEIECYAFTQCQPFRSTAWTRYLIWFRYASLFISVLLVGYGLVRRQILAVALGAGLLVDSGLNAVLKRIFRQPPPVAGCGLSPYAMPSFQAEHTAFFLVALAMYPMMWYTPRVRTTYIGLFVALYVLVIVTQMYFNFNSPEQVLVGTLFGSVFAWLWVMGTFTYLYPHIDAIIYSPWTRRLYPVVDGLGISYEPVRGDPAPLYEIFADDEPLLARGTDANDYASDGERFDEAM